LKIEDKVWVVYSQTLKFFPYGGSSLTKMLESVKLTREECFITNTVLCRPPGNRNPEPDELAACSPFLADKLGVIQPKVILALGSVATQALLRTKEAIGKLRGRIHPYGNAILMREEPAEVTKKIRTMQTDPARVRRSDKGNPERCPVWGLHKIYSDAPTRDWVVKGCTTAGIGCLECKQPVIDAIIRESEPIRERAQRYLDDPQLVRNIVADGCERARKMAEETMRDVRGAMGLDYS